MNNPIKRKSHEKIVCVECNSSITNLISSILYTGSKSIQEDQSDLAKFMSHYKKKFCDDCLNRAFFVTRTWILSDFSVGWRTDRCVEIYKKLYQGSK
jgi:hypothetical protein